MLPFVIVKWCFVASLELKYPKFQEEHFSDIHLQNILEKLPKLRKSYNHKRNINIIYDETLHYNCLQQLRTLSLKA